jgi:hypothetical protein
MSAESLGLEALSPYLYEGMSQLYDGISVYLFFLFQATTDLYSRISQEELLYAGLAILTTCVTIVVSMQPLRDLRFKYRLLFCWKELLTLMDYGHCQPLLLRLAFADASSYDATLQPYWPYCGGCNGSIRFDSLLSDPFNAGLSKALALLAPLQRKYSLSWADVIQMAGAAAVYSTGGPLIKLQYGRVDVPLDIRELSSEVEESYRRQLGLTPNSISTPAGIPHPPCPYSLGEEIRSVTLPRVFSPYPLGEHTADAHLRSVFYRMGLSQKEAVALCGAHTIGRAFQDRSGVCPFSSGDQGATSYTSITSNPHVSKLAVGFTPPFSELTR